MANSKTIRLMLIGLLTMFPLNSLWLRPNCQCCERHSTEASTICCCQGPESAKVIAKSASKLCCRGLVESVTNEASDGAQKSPLPRRGAGGPDVPTPTYSTDQCSCGCQQAPELDEIQGLILPSETHTVKKPVALWRVEPIVAATFKSQVLSLELRRPGPPLAQSSLQRCARLCRWLI